MSKKASPTEDTILMSIEDHIAVITLNRPKKFNSFTEEQTAKLNDRLQQCATDPQVKAVIITGNGKFYSAGADFTASARLSLPSTMMAHITEYNQGVFDPYINFPKPLIAAVNGPAIGMAVTSATLTDCILASTTATFHTPFVHLGLPPEGCSSFTFERIMGKENAAVLLEKGDKIDADTALRFGLVQEVVEPERLLERAHEVAKASIGEGYVRPIVENNLVEKLLEVNKAESAALGKAIMDKPFLEANMKNAMAKKDNNTAWFFWVLLKFHPVLSRAVDVHAACERPAWGEAGTSIFHLTACRAPG